MKKWFKKQSTLTKDIILYISPKHERKSMELKSGLEILKIDHEERNTNGMPYIEFFGEKKSFAQSKAIVYEHLKKNRAYRRYLKKNKIMLLERKVTLWEKIKKVLRKYLKLDQITMY